MAIAAEHINLRPQFQQTSLPCDGEVGDLLVLTPLKEEGEPDFSTDGRASLWFCTRSGIGEQPAIWARVQFDAIATCKAPVPSLPQGHPPPRPEG